MRRLCFDKFGDPAKVLRLDEQPTPKPGRGQVLMTMTCAPIHPADFALIRGVYVRPDSFPAVPGLEGLGTVTKLGPGVKGVRVGGRYLVVSRGNWASERVVPADGLVPVPKGLADEVACQSFVNPLTAFGLLEMVKRPGAVVQTAAGSAVGRLVDQIGRKQGRKVINIVRSDKTARDLKKHGAAHVVSSHTKNWQSKVMAAAGKTPIVAAFDPVAGETALSLLPLLSERGDLILYGALSGKPVEVGAMSVAGKDLSVRGYWLSPWLANASKTKRNAAYKSLANMLVSGELEIPVAGVYALDDFKQAVKAVETSGRLGKVVLKLS